MGEIADAYIWADMNGIDLDNNPEAWEEYYHDKECEEYEEEIINLKKKLKNQRRITKRLKKLIQKHREKLQRTLNLAIDIKTNKQTIKELSDDISEIDKILGGNI